MKLWVASFGSLVDRFSYDRVFEFHRGYALSVDKARGFLFSLIQSLQGYFCNFPINELATWPVSWAPPPVEQFSSRSQNVL